MRTILFSLRRLWVTDIALTTLLVFLLVYIFFIYPLGQIASVRLITNLFFLVILVTGAIAATGNRVFRTLVFSWSFLALVLLGVNHLFPHEAFLLARNSLSLFFLVLLTLFILGQAFREGPTTSHRITGAVAAYLLLGLIWSLAYYLVELGIPGSFSLQGLPGDKETLHSHFFYFSFVTLTTLGYGDIVAVHPMARMLVILEGVTGQLFPVILISRLVSLHVQLKQKS